MCMELSNEKTSNYNLEMKRYECTEKEISFIDDHNINVMVRKIA